MTPSPLPRFVGPAQVRQRMRLAAALGMLAIAAITTGGLASLATVNRDTAAKTESPRTQSSVSELPEVSAHYVERRVAAAERASNSARLAIRMARKLRVLDEQELDELEHRLDAAVLDTSSSTAPQNETRPETRIPDRTVKSDSRDLESRAL